MIRTLRLAGAHGWVSLRLTVSRGYWLPRLSLALIAGYMLLFFARHFDNGGWGPVMTAFVTGLTCISLWRADIIGRDQPLPLPQAWLTGVSIVAQLVSCVGMALGFMVYDIVTAYTLMLGADLAQVTGSSIPHVLTGPQCQAMAFLLIASIPVSVAALLACRHIEQPRNTWPTARWQAVIPPLLGITAAFAAAWGGAIQLNAPDFAVKYLQVWLVAAALITSMALMIYGAAAIFPSSRAHSRTAKHAMQQLTSTIRLSQAIKWSLLLTGVVLYMVLPSIGHALEWRPRFALRVRPLFICYGAILPFFSMVVLTSGKSTMGTQQFVGSWKWQHSGWSIVPVARPVIQRALLLDMVGFTVAATVLMHAVSTIAATTTSPELSWVQDLHTFTWFFTWFSGCTLPLMVLFMIPRRRFGLSLAVTTVAVLIWSLPTMLGRWVDMEMSLPILQHLSMVCFWVILGAMVWAQTASSTGRLFERGSPVNRGLVAIFGTRPTLRAATSCAIIIMASIVAIHRIAISEHIERHEAAQLTAEQGDRMLRDLERIAALGILNTPTGLRDAGPLLNPHIGLQDPYGVPPQEVPWWDDESHWDILKRRDHPWFDGPDDVDIGDLSILTKLMAFDHWQTARLPTQDLPPIGAYEQHLHQTPQQAYLSYAAPLPDLVPLIHLARYRLLKGLRDKDVLPALSEVRHLARLLYSTEIVDGTVMAVAILRNERKAFLAAVQTGQIATEDWDVVSEADLNTLIRVSVSMSYVMSGGASEAQWRRIDALPFEPFGLCGAIREAIGHRLSQPSRRLWPAEVFPHPDMGYVNHAVSTSTCSIPQARHDLRWLEDTDGIPTNGRLFESRAWAAQVTKELSTSQRIALHIPYMRGHIWAQTEWAQLPILMYGDTPEEDYRGVRGRRQ